MFHKDAAGPRHRSFKRLGLFVGGGLILVFLIILQASYSWYSEGITPVDPNNADAVQFQITAGESPAQIATRLEEEKLIRSERAFRLYLRLNNKQNVLQAGDYVLNQSMSVEQIVEELSDGQIESRNFTFLPGKTLLQHRQNLRQAGFTDEAIEDAFNPENYTTHPIAKFKPASASLEGYIYPETFQITDNTTARQLVTRAIDELYSRLTPALVDQLSNQGLNVHDAITLASIVEKEAGNKDEKPTIAQVFYNRLEQGIALQSDPTAVFGAVMEGVQLPEVAGISAAIRYDSPYNTYIYAGLTPGPISNVNIDSLNAVAYPAEGDFLYFVAGADCVTRFSRTLGEHESNIARFGLSSQSDQCN